MAKDSFDEFSDAPDVTKILTFGSRTGSRENFEALPLEIQDKVIAAAQAYNTKTGKTLIINSALRPLEDQKRLYDETVAAGRPGVGPSGMPVAKPGQSKHGAGYAIDIQQGKGDKDAVGILSQYGFTQPYKKDPVHFELSPQPVAAAPQPAVATQPVVAQQPQQAPVQAPVQAPTQPPVSRENQTLAGISGFGQGATAGLIQYPQALVLRATRAVTGGVTPTFGEALQDVRQGQQALREESPYTYGAGQITGGAAGLGKLTAGAGLARTAATAGGMGATAKYTEAPETTLGQAALQGAAEGGISLAGGAAIKGIGTGLSKIGETSFGGYVRNLVESGTKSGQQTIGKVFGPLYKEAKAIAKAEKPTMPRGKASEVLPKYEKDLAAWKSRNEGLTDIETFATRYADNPKLIQKYADRKGVPDDLKTSFQLAADKLPTTLGQVATGQAARNYFMQGVVTPIAGAGLIGAAIGSQFGADPYQSAIGGGLTGATLRFGVPAAGRKYFTSPTARKVVAGTTKAAQTVGPQLPRAVQQTYMAEESRQQSQWDEFPDAE
jgi:hypothetical protein